VYFAEMKRINKEGPTLLAATPSARRLPENRLEELRAGGALIVDTRSAAEFAEGHVPGTLNIPLDRSFTTWAGWLLPYTQDFWLIVDDRTGPEAAEEALVDLAMIGLDRAAGWFGAAAVEAWARETDQDLEMLREIGPKELAEGIERGALSVLDVRGESEWMAGHIPGATHIPLGYLSKRMDEVPTGRTLAVQCQSGGRSAIAASVLLAKGVTNVVNVRGGFGRWVSVGGPTAAGARTEETAGVR